MSDRRAILVVGGEEEEPEAIPPEEVRRFMHMRIEQPAREPEENATGYGVFFALSIVAGPTLVAIFDEYDLADISDVAATSAIFDEYDLADIPEAPTVGAIFDSYA